MTWYRRRYGIADYGRAFEEFEALFNRLHGPRGMMMIKTELGDGTRVYLSLPDPKLVEAYPGFEPIDPAELPAEATLLIGHQDASASVSSSRRAIEQGQGPIHEHALLREGGMGAQCASPGSGRLVTRRTRRSVDFVLVLVFLFVLLAVSALAPPARNHSAFVSFLFVADLLVFGWLFFFADFFVFIGYLLVPLCGIMLPPIWEVDHIGGLEAP